MSDKAGDTNPIAPANPLRRRGLLIGAAAAGAALIAAKVMPGAAPVAATAAMTVAKVAGTSAGYQVTAHVLRYYETTRA